MVKTFQQGNVLVKQKVVGMHFFIRECQLLEPLFFSYMPLPCFILQLKGFGKLTIMLFRDVFDLSHFGWELYLGIVGINHIIEPSDF
jgi:hypothetical protein